MEHAERDWRPPGPVAPERRIRSRLRVSPRLRDELRSDRPWTQSWSFGVDARARAVDEAAAQVERTLAETIESPVREAIGVAGEAAVLDLGCREGWLAQRMLDWGAARALGADYDETAVRRARLIAQEYGAPMRRLEFREVSHEDWRPARLGRHDVVVCRRGIGEVEDPLGLLRRVAQMTSLLLVVDTPLRTDLLTPDFGEPLPDGPGTFELRGAGTGTNGAGPSRPALVPDRAAVAGMLRTAGFPDVEQATVPVVAHSSYLGGERGVFLARTGADRGPVGIGEGDG